MLFFSYSFHIFIFSEIKHIFFICLFLAFTFFLFFLFTLLAICQAAKEISLHFSHQFILISHFLLCHQNILLLFIRLIPPMIYLKTFLTLHRCTTIFFHSLTHQTRGIFINFLVVSSTLVIPTSLSFQSFFTSSFSIIFFSKSPYALPLHIFPSFLYPQLRRIQNPNKNHKRRITAGIRRRTRKPWGENFLPLLRLGILR